MLLNEFRKKVHARWSYDLQRITPSLYVIATKNLTSVLPVPSLWPFAVQPNDNPLPRFLQIFALGAVATSNGFLLKANDTPAK